MSVNYEHEQGECTWEHQQVMKHLDNNRDVNVTNKIYRCNLQFLSQRIGPFVIKKTTKTNKTKQDQNQAQTTTKTTTINKIKPQQTKPNKQNKTKTKLKQNKKMT
jgi:hypothetical protein